MNDTDIVQFIAPIRSSEIDFASPTAIITIRDRINTTKNAVMRQKGYEDKIHTLSAELTAIDRTTAPTVYALAELAQAETRDSREALSEHIRAYCTSLNRQYENLKRGISARLRQTVQAEHAASLTVGEIRTILEAFSPYQPDSLHITSDSKITFIFENCTMTNPDDGSLIELPAMIIHIRATHSEVRITPVDVGEAFRGYDDALVVHPHITNNAGHACLGDFAGVISQSLHDADLEMALYALLEFLNTVNPNDAAGRFWPRWIDMDVDEEEEEEEEDYEDETAN